MSGVNRFIKSYGALIYGAITLLLAIFHYMWSSIIHVRNDLENKDENLKKIVEDKYIILYSLLMETKNFVNREISGIKRQDINFFRSEMMILRKDIQDHTKETNTKIDNLGKEINTKIDNLGKEMNTKIDNLGKEINTKIDNLATEIAEIKQIIKNK